jgi:hypothetical protein
MGEVQKGIFRQPGQRCFPFFATFTSPVVFTSYTVGAL